MLLPEEGGSRPLLLPLLAAVCPGTAALASAFLWLWELNQQIQDPFSLVGAHRGITWMLLWD